DVRIRPMVLVVKKWARHNQINDASKGTLSSYTLVLMVLHYLQTLREPVLPSLQRAHPESFNPSMDIDKVPDGPKNIPPYTSRNQSSLGELLLGFLRYYATEFRYRRGSGAHGSVLIFSLLFLIPFFISSCQLFLPSRVFRLSSPSCILLSGFMFLAEGQQQLG
ncbi:Poly(A) RNA polymerase GLD2, partial [Xenotaenia resolanae]